MDFFLTNSFSLSMKLIRNGEIDAAFDKLRNWHPWIVQVGWLKSFCCYEHTIVWICIYRTSFNVYLPLILSLPLLWLFWILLYSSCFVISM